MYVYCTVDGAYGPWSNFGECSVTCGDGVQQRDRKCNNPAPLFGGLSCDKLELGPNVETRVCSKRMCPGEILTMYFFKLCFVLCFCTRFLCRVF